MIDKIDEISVFFPTYSEEGNIRDVISNAREVVQRIAEKWEILVVNDGSKDGTKQIIESLEKTDPRIRLINHEKNLGYGASLQSGLYGSKYKWIVFTDSDGQFDFSEISNFLAKQKETNADLVIGYYKKRQVTTSRILTSKMWEIAVFILFGLHVHDIDCGFKLISKKVIDKIPKLVSERGAFISSELLIKARKGGYKIVEIPVTHYPRIHGAGTGRDINVIIKSFIDLLRLWRKLK